MIAIVMTAATPRSLPIDQSSDAQTLRLVVERLTYAPSDAERRHLQDLATTIGKNSPFWIGAGSEKSQAFLAIRNVLPALEPDPRRLAAANLDPRRIAFIVVECARAEAPSDFAEAASDTPEVVNVNVHVLRTLMLRSLEHLQRVALGDWANRSFEDGQSVHAAEVAAATELRPDPSNGGAAKPTPNHYVVADPSVAVMVEMTKVRPAPSTLDTALPSANDLETELREALHVQLGRREPGPPVPKVLPEFYDAPEIAPGAIPDTMQYGPAERMVAAEAQVELATPPSGTKPSKPNARSSLRFGFLWLVAGVAVGTALAALYYRVEVGAIAAELLDLFPSTR